MEKIGEKLYNITGGKIAEDENIKVFQKESTENDKLDNKKGANGLGVE